MKERIRSVIKHPLITGSGIILIGSMLASILSYFFNLGAGRLFTPSDYGSFIALLSLFNIFSVFSITISTVFAKFAAIFIAQKKEGQVGSLFVSGSVWIGALSFLISGLIILFSLQIAHFLNIRSAMLIILISASLFFSFLSYVGIGIIQGLLKFTLFCFINIFSSLIKLILGFGFILLGFKVLGAISAVFISVLLSYLLVFVALFKFFKKRKENNFTIPNLRKNLSLYALPVFLSNIGITVFVSIDIILVKHFFNGTTAGQYAALSVMGRSIFYAISPIGLVLFPLIAQKKEKKENLRGTFFLAIIITVIPSLLVCLIYFIFPQFVLKIFYPSHEYVVLTQYLGLFSIFILFYLISFLLNMFYLSIGKTKVFIFTMIAAFLEVIFIVLFHQTISQIITVLIIVSFLLMISLLLYYPKGTKSP